MPEPAPFSRFYPIVDAALAGDDDTTVDAILTFARAGVAMVQLRAKSSNVQAFWRLSVRAVAATRGMRVRLIVNDRADVAWLADAAGVHIGQDDLSAEATRRLLGPSKTIGLSAHSAEQARQASSSPVDYVAIGPVFETPTKTTEDRPVGLDGVRAARQLVEKPLVAIGGITLDRAPAVLKAGADGVAVISAAWSPLARERKELARTWMQATEG